MKKFYRQNNLLQKFDDNLFNSDHLLLTAMDLKLDIRKRFLISHAENIIEIEKRKKDQMNSPNDM